MPNRKILVDSKTKLLYERLWQHMKYVRAGCKDIWNASMLKGAKYTSNDIPICPCTATEAPEKIISYEQARLIYKNNIKAGIKNFVSSDFVHFYMDDYKFDGPVRGVWHAPGRALKILGHFAGIITPDFSTYLDFPFPLKCYNTYRMRAFGYWYGKSGGAVINNVRWGTRETFTYCFDGIPKDSIVAIGAVASRLRNRTNRRIFELGFFHMIEVLSPRKIIVYGSDNYPCFEDVRKHVEIIAFPSETNIAFGGAVG